MWTTPTDPFESSATGLYTDVFVSNFGGKIEEALKDAFNPKRYEDFFLQLEASAVGFNKTLGLGMTENLEDLRGLMFDVYEEGQKFGFSLEDSGKFLSTIQADMGRIIPISKEVTKNALMFGKAIGDTPENVGKLIAGMTAYGVSQDKAVKTMNRVALVARKSGLDAKTLTATVGKELYKTQLYGFKAGVDGLTKMAAQAQRLGFDMTKTQTTANLILNGGPEKAIEMANTLQSLGGNIGGLGDAGQLIHMAMYDMEGLQDQIIKASASSVEFNKKTGQFKIPAEEMLRMRQQADAMGLSYEDMAKSAILFRKEQEITSQVDLSKLNDQQKELVTSLSEIGENGEIKFDLPGFDEKGKNLDQIMDDVAKNTAQGQDFLKALAEYDKESNKTDSQIQQEMNRTATAQLSVSEKMLLSLQAIQNQSIFGMGKARGKKITDAGLDETMYGTAEGGYNKLTDATKKAYDEHGGTIAAAYETYAGYMKAALETFSLSVNSIVDEYKRLLRALPTPSLSVSPNVSGVSDAFVPAGGKSMVKTGFGQILPNVNDEMLFSPDISDFFSKYNESEKRLQEIGIPKGGDLSMMYKNASASPTMELTNLMGKLRTSTGPTEVKQTVEIGGKTEVTLNINTNIPQNLISQVLDASELKNTIMETVNTRLSKEFSDKLSNALVTQKR